MKKRRGLLFLGLILILSACGNSKNDDVPMTLAIIYGNHANMKSIPLHQVIQEETVKQTASNGGSVAMITSEQKPRIIANLQVKEIEGGKNAERISRNTNNLLNKLNEGAKQSAAVTPEVNLHESLLLAKKSIEKMPNTFRKIVLVDSLLPTQGEIDFVKDGYLHSPPEMVVKSLEEKKAVIDLSSVDELEVIGLGETAEPQTKLSAVEQENLEMIWKEYFQKTGAKKVKFTPSAITTDNIELDYPKVSNVPTLSKKSTELTISSGYNESPLVLDETQLAFKPDSDQFVDAAGALNLIQPLANQMIQSNLKILLVGSTATQGTEEERLTLSQQRAEAVKRILIQQGVSEEKIITVGCGSNDPWHLQDISNDGELIEDIAKLNRKIIIADYNSTVPEISEIRKMIEQSE